MLILFALSVDEQYFFYSALQRTNFKKFETNISRKRNCAATVPISCVCEQFIYFYMYDGSAYSAAGNMWTDPGNI
jgi:hypothetical protein